jgi:hypothetical protein
VLSDAPSPTLAADLNSVLAKALNQIWFGSVSNKRLLYLWHSALSHISVRINSHSLQTTRNNPTITASNILHSKMSINSKSQTEKDRPIKSTAQ